MCEHTLGELACVNDQPHAGEGHGCVHVASSGSSVDDKHLEGGHG